MSGGLPDGLPVGLPGNTHASNLIYNEEENENKNKSSFLRDFGEYGNAVAAAKPKSILKQSLKYSNKIPVGSVKIDALAAHIVAIATEKAGYEYNLNTNYYNRAGRKFSGKNLNKSIINKHVEDILKKYNDIYINHGIPKDRATAFIADLRERVNRDISKILDSRVENNSVIPVNWKRNSVNVKERGEVPFPSTLQLAYSPANDIMNNIFSSIIKTRGPFYLDNKISINKFKNILVNIVNNILIWPYIIINTNFYMLDDKLKNELIIQTKSFMEYLDSENPNLSRERIFMGGVRRKTVRRSRGKGTRRGAQLPLRSGNKASPGFLTRRR
jgi:hypothetical protein